MMFIGGLMVALAFQRCGLHRRVALSILSVVGVKPIWYVCSCQYKGNLLVTTHINYTSLLYVFQLISEVIIR